jgi:hypothetical protein
LHQPVLAAVDALDLELLTGFDPILMAELGGQHDLAFGRKLRLHVK